MSHRENEREGERPYRGEHEGRFTNLLWPVTTWVLTNLLVGPLIVVFFCLLNRTRIYGRRRVPRTRNTLLLANHQSMIDSFPLGYAAFFPNTVIKPYLIPWNPAAEENFFKNRLLAWVFHQFKCIPVRQGRRDLRAINRWVRALRGSTMVMFPEGTRSRDGTVGRGRPGVGMVILETKPTVVPVTIVGMDRVLPIGRRIPRIGQQISIYFGKPLDYADLADAPRTRESAQEIVSRAMDRIRFQKRLLVRLGAPGAHEPPGSPTNGEGGQEGPETS